MLPRQLSGRSMRCTLSTCGEISEWDSAVRSVSTAGTYFAWRTYHTRVDGLGSQAGVWYGRRHGGVSVGTLYAADPAGRMRYGSDLRTPS